MTKDEEKRLYDSIVDGLPRGSYCWDILQACRLEVHLLIDNDMVDLDIPQLRREREELTAAIQGLGRQRAEMSAEVHRLTRQASQVRDMLASMRAQAARIAAG